MVVGPMKVSIRPNRADGGLLPTGCDIALYSI